jgi:hypothetical protein
MTQRCAECAAVPAFAVSSNKCFLRPHEALLRRIFKWRIFDSDIIAIRDLLDSPNQHFLRPNVPFLGRIFKFLVFFTAVNFVPLNLQCVKTRLEGQRSPSGSRLLNFSISYRDEFEMRDRRIRQSMLLE